MVDTKLQELTAQVLIKLHEHVHDDESLVQWKQQMMHLIDDIGAQKLSASLFKHEESSSLDPTDWMSARSTAHQALSLSMDFIQNVRDRPVSKPTPIEVRAAIEDEPLPAHGQSIVSVCEDVFRYVVPYARGNIHPRYWGWAGGESTLGGVLADMIGSTIHINACCGIHSAAFVEKTVIEWMRQIFAFPKDTTGGLLVSGTSMATIISLATARGRALANVRENGLTNGPHLIVYASTEAHLCVKKAVEFLGLGSQALHLIPVDDSFRIKIDELKITIQSDRDRGFVPFCIIGNAGTVNTGAFDNLRELSAIAHTECMWFHVDGAFGSFAILDPQRRQLVAGIEQADSLAFDFHKWLHCPFDTGCVLVRDYTNLESTFAAPVPYLSKPGQDSLDNKYWFYNLGPELSRPFRALKVWFTLKEHGIDKLGQKITGNCEQTLYLLSQLEQHERIIRVVRPVSLNILNFRFEPEEFDKTNEELLDLLNNQLVVDMQTSGIAFPSARRFQNRVYIHVCIVSHRSSYEDVDIFLTTLFKLYRARLQTLLREGE